MAMIESDGRTTRFSFRVQAEATVAIQGRQASETGNTLVELLDSAVAKVSKRRGRGLELVDIGASPDVMLVLIDGTGPIEALRIALSGRRGRAGDWDD